MEQEPNKLNIKMFYGFIFRRGAMVVHNKILKLKRRRDHFIYPKLLVAQRASSIRYAVNGVLKLNSVQYEC